jgi:hypothetical protein
LRIPNVDTLADLIDRLIVEVNKLSYFENRKRVEHGRESPNAETIAYWDNLSRDCCEYRSLLKSRINECLAEIVASGEYQTMREVRTFRPPAGKLADLLADRSHEVSARIVAALEADLCNSAS